MDVCAPNCSSQSIAPVFQLFSALASAYPAEQCAILAAQCAISPPYLWPGDYGPFFDGSHKFDFIIVGAGTAGCVLADRLSASGKHNVLLLEAGNDPPDESQIPFFTFTLERTKYDWVFFSPSNKACLSYADGCFVSRAKMLGGCGSHNAMIYLRGNCRDYDEWERLGNKGWNWPTALRYFKKSERNQVYPDGKYHSTRGKLIVDDYPNYGPYGETLINAGVECGYPRVNDLNREQYLGYGYTQGTIHNGRRQSTLKNFLNTAANRTNLFVIKNAMVQKIEIWNKKAVGVRFIYNETNEYVAFCKKEVILSAGAIQSPQLLMLSGIGPAAHLRQHGISVKCDSPGVGKNLQDHATLPTYFRFRPDNGNPDLETLESAYQLYANNTGPFTGLGVFNVIGFLNTLNGTKAKYPDIQVLHSDFKRGTQNLAVFLPTINLVESSRTPLLEQNNITDILIAFATLLNPLSRGTVKLRSSSSYDKPLIDLNLLSKNEDLETMLRALKMLVALEKTKAFRERDGQFLRVPIPECDCAFEFGTDDFWRCQIRHFITTIYHPCCTCSMGKTDHAVVDHKLRVKGIRYLRVIDASVMPKIVSANPNAAVIMIAEKGADHIKAAWSY